MACFARFAACGVVVASCWLAISPAVAQTRRADPFAVCKSDKTETGIAACTAVIKGRGDRKTKATAFLSRGQIHWAMKRFAEAESDYGETIKLAPNFAALYRDRGQIRFARGDRAGAMADFSVAIEKDPFNADNHANRGYLKLLDYDFTGADIDIGQGLFWEKDHPRSHYMKGLLHYSTGRYREAVAAIAKARALGFKASEMFITMARSHFYLGAFDAASKEASDGLQVFPNQQQLIEIRARARLEQRLLTDALADAETAAQADPKDGRAHATRAAVKLASKDLAGARLDADRAIELDPKLFDAVEIKAEILLASGDRAGARALYQQSAARTDAKMDYDKVSRNRAAARIVELDKPPPIIVAELDEAELKTRCEKHGDPLRLQSCDRLVETAATPETKAAMLMLRSRAKPYEENLADLDLAVAVAPGYSPALTARAYRHLGHFGNDSGAMGRAWADADSAVRLATPGSTDWRSAILARVAVSQRKGGFADSIADLTRIVEADPETIGWVSSHRARAYLMAGRPGEALTDLAVAERAADGANDYMVDLLAHLRALALIELGRAEEANAVLASWESKRQGEFSASMRDPLKARALLLAGSDRAAFDLAVKAAGPGGRGKAAVAARGIAAARLGDALAAVSDLTTIIEEALPVPDEAAFAGLTPGFAADLFLHRGLARAQLRQVNAARADFSEAIARAPDRARAYGERARLSFMAENPAALADIAMALRIEPAEPRWLALAARINQATGDNAAAERFADAALEAKATDADLVLLRAKARLGLGKFGEAADDAATRLAAVPFDAEALLVRIEARIGQGDLKAALADADAARSANGGDSRILLALAELRARTGDAPGAIGTFEEALAKPEAALVANRRLGDLYAGIGSDQLALGYYAKALELPARSPAEEAARAEARSARDALIRKLAASK